MIDLCAAPGSWLQVASETMPPNALIIGVDIAPIRPIPRAITFQGDITSEKCRSTIRGHLKTWKADTVLHDGAPNVGAAWTQDAFDQNVLALQAMKLATDFLGLGGTFLTKVFRSKDYDSLMWVFNQLFDNVEATKPPASRNVSAEIFIVCRGFKAPQRIDPRLLDPHAVFTEVPAPCSTNAAKVFAPEKKRRSREGYNDGDCFRQASLSEFIHTPHPVAMLGSFNKFSFEQLNSDDIVLVALNRLLETNPEIRSCCSDLKVLGRKEFRALLRWRLEVREMFGLSSKEKELGTEATEAVEVESMDEGLGMQDELQWPSENNMAKKRKLSRKVNQDKKKEIMRLRMSMQGPPDVNLHQQGVEGHDSMFSLTTISQAMDTPARDNHMKTFEHSEVNESSSSEGSYEEEDDADRLDRELDALYKEYTERRGRTDAKTKVKKARQELDDDEWHGLASDPGETTDGSSRDEMDYEDLEDGLLHYQRLSNKVNDSGLTQRASSFFGKGIFGEIEELKEGPETEKVQPALAVVSTSSLQNNLDSKSKGEQRKRKTDTTTVLKSPSHLACDESAELEADDRLLDMDDYEDAGNGTDLRPNKRINSSTDTSSSHPANGPANIDIITVEAMTLAQQLASGQKQKHDLIDDDFNRNSFLDTNAGLPDWFLDDEQEHTRPNKPITAAAAAAIREKLRALNARPIRKVREAKDRRMMRVRRRMKRLQKGNAASLESGDGDGDGVTGGERARSMAAKLVAAKKLPRRQVKLVVAKGGNKGIAGRPRGIKGRYRIVDARLKKDLRGAKRAAKRR